MPLDFNQLADRAADPGNLAASATIKKEILHYDICWRCTPPGCSHSRTFVPGRQQAGGGETHGGK